MYNCIYSKQCCACTTATVEQKIFKLALSVDRGCEGHESIFRLQNEIIGKDFYNGRKNFKFLEGHATFWG